MKKKKMKKSIFLSGTGVITSDRADQNFKFFEFHPDNQGVEVTTPTQVSGKAQLMRDGTVYFTAAKPRSRNNALLIRKARHGRVSGTRDNAWQLTLKVFATEGIDWQRAFVEEPIEVMADLMGAGRMREILTDMLNRLNAEHDGKAV
jgi:hypothetical protein